MSHDCEGLSQNGIPVLEAPPFVLVDVRASRVRGWMYILYYHLQKRFAMRTDFLDQSAIRITTGRQVLQAHLKSTLRHASLTRQNRLYKTSLD